MSTVSLWDTLKGLVKGIFPAGGAYRSLPDSSRCLKKESLWLDTDSLSVTNHLFGRLARDLGRTELENSYQGNLRSGYRYSSLVNTRHKDINMHVNNNQRVTLAKEGFSSKMI